MSNEVKSSPLKRWVVSLSTETVDYIDHCPLENGLQSRSEVLERALRALRELELTVAYREAAEDQRRNPDLLLDSGIGEGLEPSDGKEWL